MSNNWGGEIAHGKKNPFCSSEQPTMKVLFSKKPSLIYTRSNLCSSWFLRPCTVLWLQTHAFLYPHTAVPSSLSHTYYVSGIVWVLPMFFHLILTGNLWGCYYHSHIITKEAKVGKLAQSKELTYGSCELKFKSCLVRLQNPNSTILGDCLTAFPTLASESPEQEGRAHPRSHVSRPTLGPRPEAETQRIFSRLHKRLIPWGENGGMLTMMVWLLEQLLSWQQAL